jgi:hypothetical protein
LNRLSLHEYDEISHREKEAFFEYINSFMRSFNYMGQDDIVAKHFIDCLNSNASVVTVDFVSYIVILAREVKNSGYSPDARSEASIKFLKEHVADIDIDASGVVDNKVSRKLMFIAMMKTHPTIFQSMMRVLSIMARHVNQNDNFVPSDKKHQCVVDFFNKFIEYDNYFPFI